MPAIFPKISTVGVEPHNGGPKNNAGDRWEAMGERMQDFSYCVRGVANVHGGFTAELHMEMEEWLTQKAEGHYVVISVNEMKFEKKMDAERFAARFFVNCKWKLRKMLEVCEASRCPVRPCQVPHESSGDNSPVCTPAAAAGIMPQE